MLKNKPGMMTCTVRVRRIFERHLWMCPECKAYVEGYRQTVAFAGFASRPPDEPAPGDVPKELVDAILAAKARFDRSGRSWRLQRPARTDEA